MIEERYKDLIRQIADIIAKSESDLTAEIEAEFAKLPPMLQTEPGVNSFIAWYRWTEKKRDGTERKSKIPCSPGGNLSDIWYEKAATPKNALHFIPAYLYSRLLNYTKPTIIHKEDNKAERRIATEGGGYGVVFSDAGIAGVDIDHCINEDGELSRNALDLIYSLNSYTEYSPSGKGVHILVALSAPDGMKLNKNKLVPKKLLEEYPDNYEPEYQEQEIEFYTAGRFFTFTGERVPDTPADIAEPETLEVLAGLGFAFIPKDTATEGQTQTTAAPVLESLQTDDYIIKKMAIKSIKAAELFAGHGGDDDSSNDQALCNCISFYTTDPAQIDRIFRRSGLYREKWERQDYRERTIKKALSSRSAVEGERRRAGYFMERMEKERQRAAKAAAMPTHEAVADMVAGYDKTSIATEEAARLYLDLHAVGREEEAEILRSRAVGLNAKTAFNKEVDRIERQERKAEKTAKKEKATAAATIQREEARLQRLEAFKAADHPQWVNTKETKYSIYPLATIENIEAYLRYKSLAVKFNELADEPRIFEVTDGGDYLPVREEVRKEESKLNGLAARISSDATIYDMPGMSAGKAALFLKATALKNSYNPFREFLTIAANHYTEQGKPSGNIEKYFNDMLTLADGAEGNREYYLYLFKYWIVQAVRLAANTVSHQTPPAGFLVLQGTDQNAGKSSFVRLLIPEEYRLTKEVDRLDVTERDSKRQAITAAVVEIPEFGSTNKKRFRDELKAFFTASMDEYRNPFDVFPTRRPRQTSFIGTINDVEFLKDDTGSRRYWVIPTKLGGTAPLEERVKNIDLLSMWGEAIEASKDTETFPIGHLPLERLTQLKIVNKQFQAPTAIETAILDTYDFSQPPTSDEKKATEIAVDIGFRPSDCRKVGRLLTTWVHQGTITGKQYQGSWSYYLPPKRKIFPDEIIY